MPWTCWRGVILRLNKLNRVGEKLFLRPQFQFDTTIRKKSRAGREIWLWLSSQSVLFVFFCQSFHVSYWWWQAAAKTEKQVQKSRRQSHEDNHYGYSVDPSLISTQTMMRISLLCLLLLVKSKKLIKIKHTGCWIGYRHNDSSQLWPGPAVASRSSRQREIDAFTAGRLPPSRCHRTRSETQTPWWHHGPNWLKPNNKSPHPQSSRKLYLTVITRIYDNFLVFLLTFFIVITTIWNISLVLTSG